MTVLPLLAQSATGSTTEVVLFVVFAGIAIGAGIAMVAMRNIVHGALMLVINLLALAGLYLVLRSSFLSIVQVIVYAGAIMVLFLFVIMLLGIDRDDLLVDLSPVHRGVAVLAGVAVVAMMAWAMVGTYTTDASICGIDGPVQRTAAVQSCVDMDALLADADAGSVEVVANDLFVRWTFPFEASALLLIVATIGAMLLGRRHDTDPEDDAAWVPSMVLPDAAPGAIVDDRDDDPAEREALDGGATEPDGQEPPVPVGAEAAPAEDAAGADAPDVTGTDVTGTDAAGDATDGRDA